MSAITLSREMANVAEAFGWGWDRLEWLTINAMKSAFLPFDERLAMLTDVIKPGYADPPFVVDARNLARIYPATPETCRYPCGWRTRDTHVLNAGNRWIPIRPTS